MNTKHFFAACLLCCCTAAFMSCSQKPAPAADAPVAEAAEEPQESDGSQYIDFAMDTPDGKTLKMSDFVDNNKYTLIDFWASWCGPCRAEMPTVAKAYDEFHAKGLEIVGVSLDNEKGDWVSAISMLNMPWPQVSDLKGWECAGAQLYNVRAIPANLLIDQQGRIVAQDLRGEDLLQKLAELLP